MTVSAGRWTVLGLPSGNYKLKWRAGASGNVENIKKRLESALDVWWCPERWRCDRDRRRGVSRSAYDQYTASLSSTGDGRNYSKVMPLAPGAVSQNASINVMNLQKRVAGVLPVAIDVPRAGTSFSFVRPLVLDEETKVTFSYKSR